MSAIIVTTGDLKQDYEVIGPVYFQVSNNEILSSPLTKLIKYYIAELDQMKKDGFANNEKMDWGFLYGEYSLSKQSDLDKAFFIAVKELQKSAERVGANAVICMRQDLKMDTDEFKYFCFQMYGTAVRFK